MGVNSNLNTVRTLLEFPVGILWANLLWLSRNPVRIYKDPVWILWEYCSKYVGILAENNSTESRSQSSRRGK